METPPRSMDRGTAADRGYGIAPPGYRLPDGTRLGPVRLQVSDLGRSLSYYRDLLGFRVLEASGERAMLAAHGAGEPLVELHRLEGAAPVPRRGRLGLYHFAILLPDRAALGRFVVHLGRTGTRPGMADHLVSEALYLQDPDGLGIEVYADRPRAAWAHRERELLMDTRPLDLESLARAGGGEPWTGMPAGTTIGHVHLHVGDLAGADAFYHAALGFERVVWSYPGALFLSAGGYHHHLGLNVWAGPGAARPGPSDARLLEWTVVVPRDGDARAAAESLRAAGYDAAEDARGRLATDPWGTSLRLVSESGNQESDVGASFPAPDS